MRGVIRMTSMKMGLEDCLCGAVGGMRCVACVHDENEVLSERGAGDLGVGMIPHSRQ